MFKVIQSNSSERLAEQLAQALSEYQTANVLQPKTVLVQSPGMAQWLKLELARQTGLAANLQFPLPASFLWNVYRDVLGEDQVPEPLAFSKPVLQFLLLELLQHFQGDKLFADIDAYLQNKPSEIKRWQLAGQIADAFDHYLVYRPQWLQSWEQGGDLAAAKQPWQAVLWRELVNRARHLPLTARHRAEVNQQCIEHLQSSFTFKANGFLPERLFVFGLSSLPPQYLNLLRALSQHIDIVIFQLNPCEHYWGDITPEKQQSKKILKQLLGDSALQDIEDGHMMIGNPLLANFGKQGREWLDLLFEIPELQLHDAFKEQTTQLDEFTKQGNSLLRTVQYEMHQLLYAGQIEPFWLGQQLQSPYKITAEDHSIEFHSCHSEQREVEVLHDWLLEQIETRELSPSDVIVMIPDIGRYAPYIDAVFMRDKTAAQQHIPYTVSDRSLAEELPLLAAIKFLYEWPDSRKTSQELFDFIALPAVSRKFELGEDELQQLHEIIHAVGIRWNLNADRSHWNMPAEFNNSWAFGLRRLLLGHAMLESTGLYDEILPTDLMAGAGAKASNALMDILDLLTLWQETLEGALSMEQWLQSFSAILELAFDLDERELIALNPLRKGLDAKLKQAQAAGYEENISREVFLEILQEISSKKSDSFSFMNGGITFCSLMPMRCIPFNTVCLLGMNGSDFPRQVNPNIFDLTETPENGKKRGDRDSRADDRYQFLEAILAAKEKLYLSFVGVSRRNNEALPPSVLVDELREYLQVLTGREKIENVQHSLQAFDVSNYDGSRELKSYESLWLQQHKLDVKTFEEKFELPDQLSISDLLSFFENPQRSWFAQAGINFSVYKNLLDEEELLEADHLEKWQSHQSGFEALKNQIPFEQWQKLEKASGNAVSGLLAEQSARLCWQHAEGFYSKLQPALPLATEYREFTVDLEVADQRVALNGTCEIIQLSGESSATRYFKLQSPNIKALFSAWIQHLLINATECSHQTEIYFQKKELECFYFPALDSVYAKGRLAKLVAFYQRGHEQASLLEMHIAWKYAQFFHDWLAKEANNEPPMVGKEVDYHDDFPIEDYVYKLNLACEHYRVTQNSYLMHLIPYEQDCHWVYQQENFLQGVFELLLPMVNACQLVTITSLQDVEQLYRQGNQ